jgi:predicted nucleotidyltransferase
MKRKYSASRNGRAPITRRIRSVAQHIAAHFQPERIILFGSYAYGKPTPDSD